jgi:hypothetical protein
MDNDRDRPTIVGQDDVGNVVIIGADAAASYHDGSWRPGVMWDPAILLDKFVEISDPQHIGDQLSQADSALRANRQPRERPAGARDQTERNNADETTAPPSSIVSWAGSCPERNLRNELIRRLESIARRPVDVTVFDQRVDGRIIALDTVVDGCAVAEPIASEDDPGPPTDAAAKPPSFLDAPTARVSGPLYAVPFADLHGIVIRLVDQPGLFPDEDQLSFVFATLPGDNIPYSRMVDVVAAHRLQRATRGALREADWLLLHPSIHVSDLHTGWVNLLLGTVKYFFARDLAWWAPDNCPGYAELRALYTREDDASLPDNAFEALERTLGGVTISRSTNRPTTLEDFDRALWHFAMRRRLRASLSPADPSIPDLSGTMWAFPSSDATVELLAGLKAHFTVAGTHHSGRWSQHGRTARFDVNGSTRYDVHIEGDHLIGTWRRIAGFDVGNTGTTSLERIPGPRWPVVGVDGDDPVASACPCPDLTNTNWHFDAAKGAERWFEDHGLREDDVGKWAVRSIDFLDEGRVKMVSSRSIIKDRWWQHGRLVRFHLADTRYELAIRGDQMTGTWAYIKGPDVGRTGTTSLRTYDSRWLTWAAGMGDGDLKSRAMHVNADDLRRVLELVECLYMAASRSDTSALAAYHARRIAAALRGEAGRPIPDREQLRQLVNTTVTTAVPTLGLLAGLCVSVMAHSALVGL